MKKNTQPPLSRAIRRPSRKRRLGTREGGGTRSSGSEATVPQGAPGERNRVLGAKCPQLVPGGVVVPGLCPEEGARRTLLGQQRPWPPRGCQRPPRMPHVLHGLLGLLHMKVCCCLQDRLTSQNQKLPGRKPCIFHDLFSPSSLCKIPCRGLARKGMLCGMFAFLLGARRKPAIYCRVNSLQSRSESNPFRLIAHTRSRTRTKRDPPLPEASAPA